jgi:hypothetical protein
MTADRNTAPEHNLPAAEGFVADSPLEGTRFEPSVPHAAIDISKTASWRLFRISRCGKVGASETPRPTRTPAPSAVPNVRISFPRLGGAEVNSLCFQPFGGYGNNTIISQGVATPSQIPGIGFEARQDLRDLFATLLHV